VESNAKNYLAWEVMKPESLFSDVAPKEEKVPRKLDVLMGISRYAYFAFDLQLRTYRFVYDNEYADNGKDYAEKALDSMFASSTIKTDQLLASIAEQYGEDPSTLDGKKWLRLYLSTMTDGMIGTRILEQAKKLAAKHKVFVYKFVDDDSPFLPSIPANLSVDDLPYEAEVAYVFMPERLWNSTRMNGSTIAKARATADKISKVWVDFIRTGEPDKFENKGPITYFMLNGTDNTIKELKGERDFLDYLTFWKDVKDKLGIEP